jgi:hypothetical protein
VRSRVKEKDIIEQGLHVRRLFCMYPVSRNRSEGGSKSARRVPRAVLECGLNGNIKRIGVRIVVIDLPKCSVATPSDKFSKRRVNQ